MAGHLSHALAAQPGFSVIIALPLAMLSTGVAFGVLLGWAGRILWLIFLIGASVLVFAYCAWVPKTGQGFDDIGYAIIAMLMAMPFGVGTLGGWLIGWRLGVARARRQDRT